MSGNARKRQLHRLKRQRKRLAARRAAGGSPYRRFGQEGEIVACYINSNWQEVGIANIFVLKRVPGEHYAMAAFLVDIWCIGLKDCYGRVDALPSEFQQSVDHARDSMDLTRVDPAVARRLVSGGIRFARQNGFRLPRHYDRWTAVLGGIGDCSMTDLTGFGVEGGRLRYVGTMEALQSRLIGCSVEQFISRKDVEFIIGGPVNGDLEDEEDDDPEEAEDDEGAPPREVVAEALDQVRSRGVDAIRRWCFANGRQPSPKLGDALGALLLSLVSEAVAAEAEDPDDGVAPASADGAPDLPPLDPEVVDPDVRNAISQCSAFVSQFKSAEEFFSALGLGLDDCRGEP